MNALAPRPYQLEGAKFLATHRRALLADEPGVGKTMQAILAAPHDAETLILCPAIARYHWERQCAQWGMEGRIAVLDSSASRPECETLICSYDMAVRPAVADWLCEQQWSVLILDESQYLKSPSSKRSRLVWRRLIHRAEYCWCLSGTPARNHAGDLWPMLSAFGVYKQGYWDFVEDFLIADTGLYGTTIRGTKPHRREALKKLLAPVMLRRTKEDVLSQLPDLTYDDVPVEGAAVDLSRWMQDEGKDAKTLRRESYEQAYQIHAALTAAKTESDEYAALAHLQGTVATSRRFLGLEKVPAIAKTISEELRELQYNKIVIFAWHRDVIQLLVESLHDFYPLLLTGSMTPREKDDALEAFADKPQNQIMIAQIIAAGVAVDMTAATEVAFAELSYVPSDNAQAVMRVHRFPQTKPVRCRMFSRHGSIDERVTAILKRKTMDLTQLFPTS